MSLTYGWDATVPYPATTETPASACAKWQDNFCYIEGALAIVSPSAGTELITNGAFTSNVDSWSASAATAACAASGQAGSCCSITVSEANGGIYQDIQVSAATVYRLTFYYKCSLSTDGPQYGIYDLSASSFLVDHKRVLNTTSWSSQRAVTFTTPTGCASVRLWFTGTGGGQVIYVDTISMKADTGGCHTFPGTYGSTAGQHLVGRSALLYHGTTTEIDALTNVQYGMSYDNTTKQFKFNTGAGASAVNDLISKDVAVTIGANIVFETSGGSVDGRKYATDGAKVDTLSEYAQHIIHARGTVAHDANIPWPTDSKMSQIADGSDYLTNGSFTNSVASWTASAASCYHAADGQSGSCAAVSALSAHGQIYQEADVTQSTSVRLDFYYKGNAGTDFAMYKLWDKTNKTVITDWTALASTTSWSDKQTVKFTVPSGCSKVWIHLGASGDGQLVYFDEVSLYKYVYPTITPASCHSLHWMIGVRSLSVTAPRYIAQGHCQLKDDGEGNNRLVWCYGDKDAVGGGGTTTGNANYIIVGVVDAS